MLRYCAVLEVPYMIHKPCADLGLSVDQILKTETCMGINLLLPAVLLQEHNSLSHPADPEVLGHLRRFAFTSFASAPHAPEICV